MYVTHSSGMDVPVEYALRVTQSTSARRLLRSWRSSLRGWASMNSLSLASNSSFGGFSYPSGRRIDSHVSLCFTDETPGTMCTIVSAIIYLFMRLNIP